MKTHQGKEGVNAQEGLAAAPGEADETGLVFEAAKMAMVAMVKL